MSYRSLPDDLSSERPASDASLGAHLRAKGFVAIELARDDTRPAGRSMGAGGGIDPAALPPAVVALLDRGTLARVEPLITTTGTPMSSGAPSPIDELRRRWILVETAPGAEPSEIVEWLVRQGHGVASAYVPPVRRPLTTARRAVRQWSHTVIGRADLRWDAGLDDAHDAVVAVIDTGVDATHPALRERLHKDSRCFVPASEEAETDVMSHGTHVAGIISAMEDGATGVGGICAARILSCKGLAHTTWSPRWYYDALTHAVLSPADILNLSVGGAGEDPNEKLLLRFAIDQGKLVVAASGNTRDPARLDIPSCPAAIDGVIAVGACDELDRPAPFSCRGPHVAFLAPGVRIISTTPTAPGVGHYAPEYDAKDGTSMAAPAVSAALALLLANRPSGTPVERCIEVLRRTARPHRGSALGGPSLHGAGCIDLGAALAALREGAP